MNLLLIVVSILVIVIVVMLVSCYRERFSGISIPAVPAVPTVPTVPTVPLSVQTTTVTDSVADQSGSTFQPPVPVPVVRRCLAKAQQPRNESERVMLSNAKRLVAEVLDHLKKQQMSQNATTILDWGMSPENVYLFVDDTSRDGRATGRLTRYPESRKACMFLDPTSADNHNEGRLQSKICHELAHLTGTGHNRKWRDTWKYLLNLTSRDLGWKNTLACGSCLKYGICNRKMCPRCTWLEGDHTRCKPLNQRGSLLKP